MDNNAKGTVDMLHSTNARNAIKLKVAFFSLGCRVNQAESEALAQLFENEGFEVIEESSYADIIVINTCTVTSTASSKSRKLIRRLVRSNPDSVIAVMGCYSQIEPGIVEKIEGVDLILGTRNRADVVKHIQRIIEEKKFDKNKIAECKDIVKPLNMVKPLNVIKKFEYEELPLVQHESRIRAMLKIQDGCSQFCTYCIIPYTRGPSRSRKPEKVLEEARRLIKAGYQEIVLTGIHIGYYGQDLKEEKYELSDIVRLLADLPGMNRLRLGSVEPMEVTQALLELVAEGRVVCPHFHIPLQSGSDSVLKRMGRPYNTEKYYNIVEKIRAIVPYAAISADVIVGFPGETEEEHRETVRFIEKCKLANIHVFPYSRRPGTPAAEMKGQLSNKVKAERVKEIINIGKIAHNKYVEKFYGETLEILIETIDEKGNARGHTSNYLEIKIPAFLNPGNWEEGLLVDCEIQQSRLVEQ